MNKNQFTVIIRSSDKDNDNDLTSNCYIKLTCPSHYKYIKCETTYFYYTKPPFVAGGAGSYTTDTIDLRSDNLNLRNHYDTKGTIALNSTMNGAIMANAKITFTTENFNNQRIHFHLFDEFNHTLQYDGGDADTHWILVLNCFGINDE
jgi:hypothetical protein